MNDRIFAFTFIVIAFFVLGFTISRAVFKSPAPVKETASVAEQIEIPEADLEEKTLALAIDESGNVATSTQESPSENTIDDEKNETITITVKETPTGWLNVREGPGITYNQVKRVNPGETYTFLEEKYSWYKINLTAGKEGWIASQYATKSK